MIALAEEHQNGAGERLTVVVAGHVDHGKSTLVGRLLAECGGLGPARLEAVQERCRRAGRGFEYAFLVDALGQEQAQGITVEAARVFLRTRRREYLLLDAPGHAELVRNMATGAARADAALLVVDAEEGVRENTRRHGQLLPLLGVRELAVVVNKMDRRGYGRGAYVRLVGELEDLLGGLGLRPRWYIPASGVEGANVTARGAALGWYDGPTLVEALDAFPTPSAERDAPFRMAVQDVYRVGERRLISGTVDAGTLYTGDAVTFMPSGARAVVTEIETTRGLAAEACVGEAIGFSIDRPAYVARGEVACAAGHAMQQTARRVSARIVWLGERPLRVGDECAFRSGTHRVRARLSRVERAVDSGDLEERAREESVPKNSVARCVLELDEPAPVEPEESWPGAGRFVLVRDARLQGGGVVEALLPEERAPGPARREGTVVWLTGLPGAGKSTVAAEVRRRLEEAGAGPVEWLDGDAIRRVFPSTGFTREAREEHVRRVAFAASLLARHDVTVLVSLVSPYESSRAFARSLCERFVEVHVATSLEECERRDPKGLYARARRGELRQFTGIDDPYEAPASPELRLDTAGRTVEECAREVLEAVERARREMAKAT